MMCEWYAMCEREAAGATPHPALGDVPICQECADKHQLPVTVAVQYWDSYGMRRTVAAESRDEARGIAQTIQARGPYSTRIVGG